MTIIESIQKNLGLMPLKKINPNTQEIMGEPVDLGNTALAQAGIPAILLGIYNRLEVDPDFSTLQGDQGRMLEKIFGKYKDFIVDKISSYSKIQNQHNEQELEHIASESIRIIKEKTQNGVNETTVRNFVAANKPDVLLYLPPSLELGTILQNNNLDDRTGKMEGPVSTFMHRMEKIFSTSGKV
jgi:hypothetical protein